MREKLFKGSVVVAMLLLGTGCGGGSSSDDSTLSLASENEDGSNVEKKIAYYIDSAVEGVAYKCVSNTASVDKNETEGTTDSNGAFDYTVGDICTFSIGNITLKTLDTKDLKDNIVFEDDENTARFLQTLDIDGDSTNGIQIDRKVVEKIASGEIALKGKIPNSDEAYTQLVTELQATVDNFKGNIVTEEEAKAHLSNTKAEIEALDGHMEAEGNVSDEVQQPATPTGTPTPMATPAPSSEGSNDTIPTSTPTPVPTPEGNNHTIPTATPTPMATPAPSSEGSNNTIPTSTPTPVPTPAPTPEGNNNTTPTATPAPSSEGSNDTTPTVTPTPTSVPTPAPTPAPNAEGSSSAR